MGSQSSFRSKNRINRKSLYVQHKKAQDKQRRDLRFRRKKEERANPSLREERLAQNKPRTIESKRQWDDVDDDSLSAIVDVEALRRRRLERTVEETKRKVLARAAREEGKDDDENMDGVDSEEEESDDSGESLLDSDSEDEDEEDNRESRHSKNPSTHERDESPAPSLASATPSTATSIALSTTSTNLDITPSFLALKFPSLFQDGIRLDPKILVTTSLNATIHSQAKEICSLFPNSTYIRRSSHRYGHKYSVREISKFAYNRGYTSLLVVREDEKKPTALTMVHLPSGPTFTFSISSWIEGKKIPGHGNATNHHPELLLNNFKTPLGLLTARMFVSLFPQKPEIQGRMTVTFHNQRDYIFVRRHRYVMREKRETEKSVQGTDGKPIRGVEKIRVGLQELGPRFTLKLRRVDQGIGRAGSEGEDAVQWEWKAGMEKNRTRFSL